MQINAFTCEDLILILISAILLDILFAEPPEIVHPVVWFGNIIKFLNLKLRHENKLDLITGFISTITVILFAITIVLPTTLLIYPLNLLWAIYLLYTSISIKSMVLHAKKTFQYGKIDASNVQMIVSRDTKSLNEEQLISAVIESVAENFVDGVLAPLFYFSIFGILGAVVYKAINVCDAMIGYKNTKYFYFGKFAARLDDLMNFIPSRLSILIFSILSFRAFRYALKYKTKLNGHAISAMAGLLNVKLEKPGKYKIDGKIPTIKDIERSIKYYWMLCFISTILSLLVILSKC